MHVLSVKSIYNNDHMGIHSHFGFLGKFSPSMDRHPADGSQTNHSHQHSLTLLGNVTNSPNIPKSSFKF